MSHDCPHTQCVETQNISKSSCPLNFSSVQERSICVVFCFSRLLGGMCRAEKSVWYGSPYHVKLKDSHAELIRYICGGFPQFSLWQYTQTPFWFMRASCFLVLQAMGSSRVFYRVNFLRRREFWRFTVFEDYLFIFKYTRWSEWHPSRQCNCEAASEILPAYLGRYQVYPSTSVQ